MRIKISVLAALLVLISGVARADTLSFVGYFNDSGNSALVGSDLGPALFADDWDVANNVALYDLVIPHGGIVGFRSFGYATGGAEPYFSLFSGSRASMATAAAGTRVTQTTVRCQRRSIVPRGDALRKRHSRRPGPADRRADSGTPPVVLRVG